MMTLQTKNAVLAGTASEVDFTGLVNASDHTLPRENVHRIMQANRLSHRFGLPPIRADLIARFAYGGGHV